MIKLVDIFIVDDLKNELMNYYNSINVKEQIDITFATNMVNMLYALCSQYLQLNTDFKTVQEGKDFIKTKLIFVFGIPLVVEYKNYFKSLNENLAEIHQQTKFNPLNNENINEAPIQTDDTTYDLASTMLTATNFIRKNRVFTRLFIRALLAHTIVVI